MTYNFIKDTDSYKLLSHFGSYPDDLEYVFSYAESRGGRYPATVFFGLQPLLAKIAANPVTMEQVEEMNVFAMNHGGSFNYDGWKLLVERHGGRLPLRIKAVPEGTLVPTRNVLCTVENTDPDFAWLTSYIETALLRQIWYASTVATRIFHMKRGIAEQFEATTDGGIASPNFPFALLDFSSRGCASYEANEIGGAAYLAHFLGSDSVPAVDFVNRHYHPASGMSGFSVPATEHSIMCSWGSKREYVAMKEIITRFGGPGKIVSLVADTWNVFEAAEYLASIADWIKSTGTTLVFRPDSGELIDVLPRALNALQSGFGSTINSKGFYVLNGVKVLWGDGITEETFIDAFDIAGSMKISADSIMIGSGGGLMQRDIDRDTCKWAFKASAVKFAGSDEWKGIRKDPITDKGKQSKEGRLVLHKDPAGGYMTVDEREGFPSVLQTVFENGGLYNAQTIDAIRDRIDLQL